MSKQTEALKLALEALEEFGDHYDHCPQYPTYAEPEYHPPCNCGYESAITALRRALEQQVQQQEPVAIADGTFNHNCPIGTPLYTSPPASKPEDK